MSPDLIPVPLYRLGHSRSGDKGDISNLSLIAWDPECYAVLEAQATEARVGLVRLRHPRRVTRYLGAHPACDELRAEGVLDGGVNDASIWTHARQEPVLPIAGHDGGGQPPNWPADCQDIPGDRPAAA